MKQVGLLLIRNFKLLSVAAILDVFETANKFYTDTNQSTLFNINLIKIDDHGADHFSNYNTQNLISDELYDLLLIPSFSPGAVKDYIVANQDYLPWLNRQHQKGTRIATFCTGAFLLAASGLLNGKVATTHVDACPEFNAAFPDVLLRADKTVTQDGLLYTSGGATSTFHLLLHLLQYYCGKDIAVRAAKIYAIDMNRDNQSYFSTFKPFTDHNDTLVASAQKKIEDSFQYTGTIEEMIKDIPSSRRNIVRRFKLVTGITPIEYLQQTRVEAAKKLLVQTDQQMMEVIVNSGYNDPKAFRKIFRKNVGMTPSEYRDKFNAIQ
ncbi:Transcriptional regulator, AraC family [Arcticibacter svalbardensis MN12-7]|uniref:Transcriptional regulator, AraC family n=1 Tax=Arcticibacter svalbardensis MN12-7 TaxID=1150600 RepID=R9H2F2_9SPHI|nr:helix-turn-helix domain-containing protein [Arcticibacter svalbardensis]EOR95399.1 Transcriptional regulator, AraC family [Arcticibacter svalbardensis MN12-7]